MSGLQTTTKTKTKSTAIRPTSTARTLTSIQGGVGTSGPSSAGKVTSATTLKTKKSNKEKLISRNIKIIDNATKRTVIG